MVILTPTDQPLQIETKRQIFQEHRRGESAEALAQRFCRSCTRIYGVIKEIRTVRIMELPLDCMGGEQFARLRSEKQEREILLSPPESDLPAKKPRLPSGLPAYVACLYEVPLLTREQEAYMFRKMNYLKYKAGKLRARLDVNRPKSCLMGRIEELYEESVAINRQIVRAQPSAGGLDCQAVRRSGRGTFSNW